MSSTLVCDFLSDWVAIRSATVRARTIEQYRGAVGVICAAVGDRALEDLTPAACAAVYAPIVAAGHNRSAQIVHTVFAMAMRSAVDFHLLPVSPMQGLHRPKYDEREIDPFDADDAAALLADPAHGIAWQLLRGTGMRRGEACALRWSDIDLRGGMVSISRQLVASAGALVESAPKSKAGVRVVPISAELCDALRMHLRKQFLICRRGDYVISSDGARINPRTLNAWLSAAAERADVLAAHPHRWRHTYGADAVSAGIDIRVLQRLLGHSNISVTARYYAYVRPDVLRSAADQIAAYQAAASSDF